MSFEEQLARIHEIDGARLGGNVAEAHCKLVNQFLKSAATMLSDRNSEIHSPHFEPCDVFSGDETIDKDLKAKLRRKFEKSFFSYQVICRHLRLAKLSEYNETAAVYSDLYEPLVQVLEDGGLLDLDRTDIVVDGKWTAPVRNFRERYSTKPAE